ncbi:unnamed protein product [Didymodactylos carnosus]|uniref:G-protein coupled receptors family 1 profile domain-containing protein n=1 Tax=Didymodactylos carnosus TaxID=1234261 RepID=A0A814REM0_9BILA|nr:unnamed protein product [Didymodactylos carnosus]CAF3896696.1 unnamed protein product [Didymodactylos carnosus]
MKWDSINLYYNQICFYITLGSLCMHCTFWIQVILHHNIRQRSLQWIYSYLFIDILLMSLFFLQYGIRTKDDCFSNTVFSILCTLEAYSAIYLSLIQPYLLVGLNICRYLRIVKSLNVYTRYIKTIYFIHILLYISPSLSFILQFQFGWSMLESGTGAICDLTYSSMSAQSINIMLEFIIPVSLNIIFMAMTLVHIRHSKRTVNAERQVHKRLLLQFFIVYMIWLLLWGPFVLIYQFTKITDRISFYSQIISFCEVFCDPFIFIALDNRFIEALKKSWKMLKNIQRVSQIQPSSRAMARSGF